MPNHFHLLIRIKELESIPEQYQKKLYLPFSNLFNAYAKAINKAYDRSGSLFQEHLHRNRVTNEKYLIQLIAYIHLNPVRHGFRKDFENYPFSSYHVLLSDIATILERDQVIEMFDDLDNFKYWHDLKKIRYTGILEEIDRIDE